jgi:glucan phosphorylase
MQATAQPLPEVSSVPLDLNPPVHAESIDLRAAGFSRDQRAWTRMSILNSARMEKFSLHHSIHDYCERVWKMGPGNS